MSESIRTLAEIADHASAIFVTAGEGTQHRPR